MSDRVKQHLELRRPGIERIATLCEECLEHDSSWWEFKDRCIELLKKEEKVIRMLASGRVAKSTTQPLKMVGLV